MDLSKVSTNELVKELENRTSDRVNHLNESIRELEIIGVKMQDTDGEKVSVVFEKTDNPSVVIIDITY